MRPPLVSRRQSDARVRQLRAAGCKVEKRRVGDEIVVLKSCPPGARVPPLSANPIGTGWLVAGLVGAFGLLWWLGSKKAEAATSSPSCAIDMAHLHAWGLDNETAVLYLPLDTSVPDDIAQAEEQFKKMPGFELDVLALQQGNLVLVTKDGAFWTYGEDGKRQKRDDLRSSYCAHTAKA